MDERETIGTAGALARRRVLQLAMAGTAAGMSPLAYAQSGAPRRGGTLTIGADADPIGLDPNKLTAFSSYDFTSLLYTGLLRWTPDMKPEPDLATGFTQENETTYVFKLRSGVKFHNGATFDANYVVESFGVQWDAAHPLHVGRDGSFTYFPGLFGQFLNAPPAE